MEGIVDGEYVGMYIDTGVVGGWNLGRLHVCTITGVCKYVLACEGDCAALWMVSIRCQLPDYDESMWIV